MITSIEKYLYKTIVTATGARVFHGQAFYKQPYPYIVYQGLLTNYQNKSQIAETHSSYLIYAASNQQDEARNYFNALFSALPDIPNVVGNASISIDPTVFIHWLKPVRFSELIENVEGAPIYLFRQEYDIRAHDTNIMRIN